VVTDRGADHSQFEELAAGYALDALSQADEQRFLLHAEQCPGCRELVAEFRQVAGALAEASPPGQPGAELGDRILAAAMADAGPQDSLADGARAASRDEGPAAAGRRVTAGNGHSSPVALRARGRRWKRPLAVAAAAVLLAGGGIWAGLAATSGGARPPLAACERPQACPRVVLTATRTGRVTATVIVHDGVAWMEPTAMAANPAGEIYVLWQITGSRTPLPVGSFDVRPHAHGPVRVGSLAIPYSGTRAFAVSLEHGRTIPASPSKPVALGQVS